MKNFLWLGAYILFMTHVCCAGGDMQECCVVPPCFIQTLQIPCLSPETTSDISWVTPEVAQECPICLETVATLFMTHCGHVACQQCAYAWFVQQRGVCHVCRSKLERAERTLLGIDENKNSAYWACATLLATGVAGSASATVAGVPAAATVTLLGTVASLCCLAMPDDY